MDARIVPSRRRAAACDPCRKRKLRCDRSIPCSMCVRSRREECSYSQSHRAATTVNPTLSRPVGRVVDATEDVPRSSNTLAAAPVGTVALRSGAGVDPTSPEQELESSLEPGTWHHSTLGSLYVSQPSSSQELSQAGTPSAWEGSPVVIRPGRSTGHSKSASAGRDRADTVAYQDPNQWLMSLGGLTNPIKGIMFKGKYFGQTHWFQSLMLVSSKTLPRKQTVMY